MGPSKWTDEGYFIVFVDGRWMEFFSDDDFWDFMKGVEIDDE